MDPDSIVVFIILPYTTKGNLKPSINIINYLFFIYQFDRTLFALLLSIYYFLACQRKMKMSPSSPI